MTPHKFRHSCATHMHEHGSELNVIQQVLGHAEPESTLVYTRLSSERLVKDYRQGHPRAETVPEDLRQ